MSSSRVRSAPRARAMVESRWMAFRRRRTSSCCPNRVSGVEATRKTGAEMAMGGGGRRCDRQRSREAWLGVYGP